MRTSNLTNDNPFPVILGLTIRRLQTMEVLYPATTCAYQLLQICFAGYGMTESAPVTLFPPKYAPRSKMGSCGQLVPETQAKVVDLTTGQSLGPHQSGELLIRGPQVSMPRTWQTSKDLQAGHVACKRKLRNAYNLSENLKGQDHLTTWEPQS
jgi:acyl-CoA synthetase (AMP-forming)/AMP-acid ligase II